MPGPGLLPTKAPSVTREQGITVIALGPEYEIVDGLLREVGNE